MKDPTDYNVRAVERALQIMSSFDDAHPERGVSEIAQLVGLHKATTHRIMVTLLNYGFLERTADGERYRLGLRVASLGLSVLRRLDLRREALPYLKQLQRQFEETSDLAMFDQGEVFYVEVVRSHQALNIASAVGQRLPAHCTATGKVFLAALSPAELDAYLTRPLLRHTDKTITSAQRLREELEKVRRQGYGVDDEEFEVGIRAVAAPIRNSEGKVVAAIGMPGPTRRMRVERVPEIAAALKEAADAISQRMGWRG